MRKLGILWLRNDLRIHVNPALSRALTECDEIIPVFVFESRIRGGEINQQGSIFIKYDLPFNLSEYSKMNTKKGEGISHVYSDE